MQFAVIWHREKQQIGTFEPASLAFYLTDYLSDSFSIKIVDDGWLSE